MITLLLAIGAPMVYITLWMTTSRVLFRTYRAHEARKRLCEKRAKWSEDKHERECKSCRNDVLWWETPGRRASGYYSDNDLAGIAILQGFIWFIILPAVLVYRFTIANPPLTPEETRQELDRQAVRIRELEKELDRELEAGE